MASFKIKSLYYIIFSSIRKGFFVNISNKSLSFSLEWCIIVLSSPKGKHIMKINIVLYQPEIPQNTGNIARTCAATGASLHLIRPLGFKIDNAKLKRAGLDYWEYLDISYYDGIEDFYEKNPAAKVYYFSTKAPKNYVEVDYPDNVFLMFGPETRGIPEDILKENYERCVRIPMRDNLRSLNLSNSVAIAVYEALRQDMFSSLLTESDYLK